MRWLQYRSNFEINIQVLKHIKYFNSDKGLIVTHMLSNVRIPHNRFKKICSDLVKSELIVKDIHDNHVYYKVTGKGKTVINEYDKFNNIVTVFGLRM